jgi:catechol 2,3-dioxygenase-like lactoylglutathione lyase family enzyme
MPTMISGLDHVVVLVQDIAAAAATYQTLLGVAPAWRSGGEGSQTVLFTLDNTSLELLAPAGEGADADRIRSVLKLSGEGLASLCFRVDDIGRCHRRLERVALRPEPIAEVESRDSDTGAVLAWQRTRAATDATHGVRLFFLDPAGERPRSRAVAAAPISGLDHVVISTADCERAAALYGARLGLDMALDRSHQDWGRLMFFRCGDLIVELVHRPVAGSDNAHDKLWGLSWRAAELEATRSRLLDAGVAVSEIRAGRKSGTRVLTVRSGSCGIPTLLVEPAAKRP